MTIQIDSLNTIHGDKEMHFVDGTPEERNALATQIVPLMTKGYSLFLISGEESHQITGYDPETNEWMILADTTPASKKGVKARVPAAGTKAKAVPAVSGG